MAHRNLLDEPIEVTLEGKLYVIKKITWQMLKKADKVQKNKNKSPSEILCEVSAIFLGGEAKDYQRVDARKLVNVLVLMKDVATVHMRQ